MIEVFGKITVGQNNYEFKYGSKTKKYFLTLKNSQKVIVEHEAIIDFRDGIIFHSIIGNIRPGIELRLVKIDKIINDRIEVDRENYKNRVEINKIKKSAKKKLDSLFEKKQVNKIMIGEYTITRN